MSKDLNLKDEYKDGMITIPLEEYYELSKDSAHYNALLNAGVDNWEWYEEVDFNDDDFYDEFWSEYCEKDSCTE